MDLGFHREVDDVAADGLWPTEDGITTNPEASRRHTAIAMVLCRIPPDEYEQLCSLADDFIWFVPHYLSLAEIQPFSITEQNPEPTGRFATTGINPAPFAKVLYLSPLLEDQDEAIVRAVVAHELAHIFLNHSLWHKLYSSEYDKQEAEVYEKLCEWGFEADAKEHRAYSEKRDADRNRHSDDSA